MPRSPKDHQPVGFGIPDFTAGEVLDVLPAAIYVTDSNGYITYYNSAAAELWGRHPQINDDRWCGSWRLQGYDGANIPLEDCPHAVTVRENRAVRGQTVIVEREDGSSATVRACPTPLRDGSGALIGAINMLLPVDPD